MKIIHIIKMILETGISITLLKFRLAPNSIMAKLSNCFSEKEIPVLKISVWFKKVLLIDIPIKIAMATEPIGIKDEK